jgi:hypothetical protein
MKRAARATLVGSLVGTIVGTWVAMSGTARMIWPAHPYLAAFLITLAITIIVEVAWPEFSARQKPD